MRHARFNVEALTVNGVAVPLRSGSLVVADPAGITTPDWEVICSSRQSLTLEHQPYDLMLRSGERSFSGAALLVRSDGSAHVFRGGSPLEGLDGADLRD